MFYTLQTKKKMAENRKFSHTGWVIVSVTKNDGSLRENPNLSERVGSSVYNRWGEIHNANRYY